MPILPAWPPLSFLLPPPVLITITEIAFSGSNTQCTREDGAKLWRRNNKSWFNFCRYFHWQTNKTLQEWRVVEVDVSEKILWELNDCCDMWNQLADVDIFHFSQHSLQHAIFKQLKYSSSSCCCSWTGMKKNNIAPKVTNVPASLYPVSREKKQFTFDGIKWYSV